MECAESAIIVYSWCKIQVISSGKRNCYSAGNTMNRRMSIFGFIYA